MSPAGVVLLIFVLSLVGPFIVRLHRSGLTWVTLFLVNFVIITVFVIVRNTGNRPGDETGGRPVAMQTAHSGTANSASAGHTSSPR